MKMTSAHYQVLERCDMITKNEDGTPLFGGKKLKHPHEWYSRPWNNKHRYTNNPYPKDMQHDWKNKRMEAN